MTAVVSLGPDLFATGSWDKSIRLWCYGSPAAASTSPAVTNTTSTTNADRSCTHSEGFVNKAVASSGAYKVSATTGDASDVKEANSKWTSIRTLTHSGMGGVYALLPLSPFHVTQQVYGQRSKDSSKGGSGITETLQWESESLTNLTNTRHSRTHHTHLVSASQDKLVRVWDVVTGLVVQELSGHTGMIVRLH